jgi:hypothetical protein
MSLHTDNRLRKGFSGATARIECSAQRLIGLYHQALLWNASNAVTLPPACGSAGLLCIFIRGGAVTLSLVAAV